MTFLKYLNYFQNFQSFSPIFGNGYFTQCINFVPLMAVVSKVARVYLSTGEFRDSQWENPKKLQASSLIFTHLTPWTHLLQDSKSRHRNHSREVQMNQLQDSRTLSAVLFSHLGKEITRHRIFRKRAKRALRQDTTF